MAPHRKKKVDYYPTVEEILHDPPVTCNECGHQFRNSSACRFHQLKMHPNGGVKEPNDQRIISRTSSEPNILKAFHCPHPDCMTDDKWFEGLRYVRQHYKRTHVEKKFVCEMCGHKLSLAKDMNYHRKVRCVFVKKQKEENERRMELLQRDNEVSNSKKMVPQQPMPSQSSATVLQPILFIVNPENVHSVMETMQKTLNNGVFGGGISAEASTQVQMPFLNEGEERIPMYANTATTTSFATQYDQEPVTFCERGTMMNEQEPLSYFSPPYGAEFGDMTPREKSQQQFDYSTTGVEPTSSSQQPQTRSFGTMFENVTTCNTGTSMIDESYVSEFLRDIETQTPSYMIQHQQTSSTSTSASTSANTAPASTSTNDWTWTRDI